MHGCSTLRLESTAGRLDDRHDQNHDGHCRRQHQHASSSEDGSSHVEASLAHARDAVDRYESDATRQVGHCPIDRPEFTESHGDRVTRRCQDAATGFEYASHLASRAGVTRSKHDQGCWRRQDDPHTRLRRGRPARRPTCIAANGGDDDKENRPRTIHFSSGALDPHDLHKSRCWVAVGSAIGDRPTIIGRMRLTDSKHPGESLSGTA